MEELNLTELKADVKEVVEPFLNELLVSISDNIITIYLTGSAVTADYLPKKSDINSLLIVKEIKLDFLDYLASLGKKYGKKGVSAPLIMTPDYLERSLDVFPIEFLELKTVHQLLYGQNFLADLKTAKSDLRLQCERELKGVLVNLRQSYIRANGDKVTLNNLLVQAAANFIPIFRGLIHLRDCPVFLIKKEVLAKVEELYQLDLAPFHTVLENRESGVSLKVEAAKDIFIKSYRGLEKLIGVIDALSV